MEYDPGQIEDDWRRRWAESGRYEADPDDEEPTFITVPYPYPSGGMHIGHARTYTVPDVYARYRRLQGDNVLFPIAWHVTGTPIVGAVERLKNGEEAQLSVLRDTYNVPEKTLSDLETPMGFARYFIDEHYRQNMRQLGLSIDWRRQFTTNDDRYSAFITWQYETLYEQGLLENGLHPVNFCTNEEQPVTTHDLLEGEEAEFQAYTLIMFELPGSTLERDGPVYAPMATLRPETIHGVTNAYINPDAEYALANVEGESWVVSVEAIEKLDLQDRDVMIERRFEGSDLVGETVTNPVTNDDVLILPAEFVDPDSATGIVMSVPGHSPDDYIALENLQERAEELEAYGIDPDRVRSIEPKSIIDVEGYGDLPAKDAIEARNITDPSDPAVEEATQEVYNREFHSGRLKDMYGEYAGAIVEEVREELREHYQRQGAFDELYDFAEEVICRCGGEVEVAYQETWFLRYNDPEWKQAAHAATAELTAIPENTRQQYDHRIDELHEWPCIRNYGLGTRLPWDDDFVIEPLSDSTIYMAYYTIAHRIEDVPLEDLDRAFFDTLFFGEPTEDGVEAPDRALDLREEWEYWYPVDFRCSGNDLINNHLTFHLFHHATLFDEWAWPSGITVMGMGLLEGEKMSSSKGHVVLPREAIETYGADTVRFFLLNSAEPWQDYDWRADQVESTRTQLERFWNRAEELIEQDAGEQELKHIDRWLLGELQSTIRTATEALEGFETRTASQAVFYSFEEHLRWYRRRAQLDRPGARWTLRHVLETRLRLLAPFVPFLANELHERLTGTPAESASWPEPDPTFESERTRLEESLIEDLHADIQDIIDVTEQDPAVIRIYTAAEWKQTVFEEVAETGTDIGAVMGSVMQRPSLRERGNAVNDLVQELVEAIRGRDDEELNAMEAIDEHAVYEHAIGFLEREYEADVEVFAEDDDPIDPEGKADHAVPFRPAIHLE